MRVLMVSKALVVGTYQRKLEELAGIAGLQLTVAVPPFWREKGHDWRLERSFCSGYELRVLPMRLNGHYHLHYYPGLGALLDRLRPELLHFDEEPYNLATWLAAREARRRGIPFVFFTWQNIAKRYPPPFDRLERQVLGGTALAIAGNQDAEAILRRKGYAGPIHVIPQFGIDPDLFAPASGRPERPFTVGFVGRLIGAKGLGVLLRALAGLAGTWRLEVVGSGPQAQEFRDLATHMGIDDRVDFKGQVPSTSMPDVMRGFDVLAGPSLTTRSWKEQFGRMLVEAMSCQVPVIGSNSGEIPEVIGDAGLVVPEDDAGALRSAIRRLMEDAALREALGHAGRRRVLDRFTQAAVARQTALAYRQVLGKASPVALAP